MRVTTSTNKTRIGEFQQLLEGIRAKLALSAFQSRQAALGLPVFADYTFVTPKTRAGWTSLRGKIQKFFPNWTHLRDRYRLERRWLDPEFTPFWKTDGPQKEIVAAVESGWFPKINALSTWVAEAVRFAGGWLGRVLRSAASTIARRRLQLPSAALADTLAHLFTKSPIFAARIYAWNRLLA
jgi:hypothetical protein